MFMQLTERSAPPGGVSALWSDWPAVLHQLAPRLQDIAHASGRVSVWCTDSVADAVALTTACWQVAAGGIAGLQVYAPAPSDGVEPLSFRLGDIRSMPVSSRHATLRRRHGRWLPRPEVTGPITLRPPLGRVDLVITGSGPGPDPVAVSETHLRPGGLLATPALHTDGQELMGRGLMPISSIGRGLCLYRYTSGGGRSEPGDAAEEPGESLAQHQRRAELVDSHLHLARSLARRFANRGEPVEDLEQVALLALVKAAKRFDEARYEAFAPYATACVLGEIKKHFRDRAWALRVPRSLQETFLEVKRADDDLVQEISRSPTVPEIAERVGITEEAVLEAMEASTGYWTHSFDYVGDDGSSIDVPYEEQGYSRAVERLQVAMLAPRLRDLEATVVRRIYFEGLTQSQVAAELGCSQMHVCRVVRSALEKLRE
jgi:RNA polymerase sigma-B factor